MQTLKWKMLGLCRCFPDWGKTSIFGIAVRGICAGFIALLVSGCVATRPAPVAERLPEKTIPVTKAPVARAATGHDRPRPYLYTVRTGDTLYGIALEFGLDYRELATWNDIDPSRLRVGQQLRLSPPRSVVTAPLRGPVGNVEARPLDGSRGASVASSVKTEPRGTRVPYTDQVYAQISNARTGAAPRSVTATESAATKPKDADDIDWIWPVSGKIVSPFKDKTSKGLGIAGKMGQSVVAAGAGRVIFSGTGIRGLGKLIVIKHNDKFLSVYAHNRELLVKEGQSVSRGQKIAEMGNTDSDQVKLHFEIRRLGKPVDPVTLLPPA